MIGSLLTRGMTLALGYLYPAYECFKTVEQNRPELDQLRFWCEYWMIIAIVTVLERVGGDALISWLPLYGEAKLAFIVYLWYPQTKGTTYVYATFVRPFVTKYENDIDGNLGELRSRFGDLAFFYWQRSSTFFRTRFVELLHFLASQSPSAGPYVPRPPSGPPPGPSHPSRLNAGGRSSSGGGGGGGGGFQPSAPQAPPGYPGTNNPGAPPPGYPSVLSQPSGTYPPLSGAPGGGATRGVGGGAGPAGSSTIQRGGSGNQPSAPPVSGGTYPPPRSRSNASEEEDEFEIVDNNAEGPNAPSVPPYYQDQGDAGIGGNGYLTRSRQRQLRSATGSSNVYYAGGGS